MPPHLTEAAMPLRQALTRSLAEDGEAVRAVPFNPDARSLANVLLDLRDARADWDQALKDAECADREGNERLGDAAADRMSEADRRTDALRDEFKVMFRQATGVSWSQIEAAQEGLLL